MAGLREQGAPCDRNNQAHFCVQALGIDSGCTLDPPPDFYALTESGGNAVSLTRLAFNSATAIAGPVLVTDGTATAFGDAPFIAVSPGGAPVGGDAQVTMSGSGYESCSG